MNIRREVPLQDGSGPEEATTISTRWISYSPSRVVPGV